MKQLVANLKTGELMLKDVPVPLCKENGVLVKTYTSLVSIGTEKSIIDLGNRNLIGKAKARPDLFKRALEKARSEGFLKVYRESKERLDEPFPLGYSASGVITEVGKAVSKFHVGDRVAICGGGFANHAEYNYVPMNLCVPLPIKDDGKPISFEEGAFGMVGAIALHGIREAQVTPGETVLIIGLGLLGLIAIQMIRSMGCFAIGVDIDPMKINLAKEFGEKLVLDGNDPGLEKTIFSVTGNIGVDSTIITAATKTNNPIETAQKCTRIKGRIVLVGVSDIHLDRKSFWEKELSFSVSRGDGPGMFDENYIFRGIDYPIEYVRWTKKRNVDYFLKLVANGSIKIERLITHRHPFSDAEKVYDKILKGKERYIGILFSYDSDQDKVIDLNTLRIRKYVFPNQHEHKQRVVGFIGGGIFVKNILLPEIGKMAHVKLKSIATTRGMTADHIAEKYGFFQSTTSYKHILSDPEIDTVIITTQHDSHAEFVVEAIRSGKNVFVEKPLCLNEKELAEIVRLKKEFSDTSIMVGYNRRFSPHVEDMKAFFAQNNEPKVINYRVNAGFIPLDHWTQDFERGGGRIIGELCHFVDLCMYLTESKPHIVFAQGISKTSGFMADDNIIANLKFENGSVSSIIYTAMGANSYNREFLEIFSGGAVYNLIDFRKGVKIRDGKIQKVNRVNKDIGHKNEMKAVLAPKIKELIPFDEIVVGTLATFSILESLKAGIPINVQKKTYQFLNKQQRISG